MTSDCYEVNRRLWDERARFHVDTEMYREFIGRLRAGQDTLLPFDDRVLGELTGLKVLHLQCHIGTDTLSLARRGAKVVGVDFSEQSIARARALSTELAIPAEFLIADVYRLREVLSGQFDLVYTSYGVLCWLADLAEWARIAADFVVPDGRLVVIDGHPLTTSAADDGVRGNRLTLDWPYLPGADPIRDESSGSYADPSRPVDQRESFQWSHGLGEIVQSVIDAGLTVTRMDEHAEGFWPRFEGMIRNPDRTWRLPHPLHGRYPMTFTLVARKPSDVAFRYARATDGAAIVALVESAYRGESSRAGWTTEADLLGGQRTDVDDIAAILAEPESRLLLATQGDAILGSVLLRRERDGLYVGMLAVRPQLQARGLGRRLLTEAESRGRQEFGVKRARMTVIEQRRDLIAWYERRGYVATGHTEPFPYDNPRFGLPKRDDLRFIVLAKDL